MGTDENRERQKAGETKVDSGRQRETVGDRRRHNETGGDRG